MNTNLSFYARVYLTAVLICCGGRVLGAPPKPDIAVSLEGHAVTIPMMVRLGHIFISVEINGKPAVFVLDSGAGVDILSTDSAKRLGITAIPSNDYIIMLGAGGDAQAWPARLETLKVGDVLLKGSSVVLADLPRVLKADGVLGYEFLQQFVTTIDYQAQTVTLRDAPASPAEGTVLPMTVMGKLPVIDADLDGVRGRFMIDTGDSGSLEVNSPFVKRNHLRNKYTPHLDMVTGVGIGGEDRSSVVRIPSLKVGALTIKKAIGNLSLQKEGGFSRSDIAGAFGYDVLSRFRITLDYKNKKVILADAGVNDQPFEYNRSGLSFSIRTGVLIVSDVIKGSPADLAGVTVGEQILAVNDEPVIQDDYSPVRLAVRGAPGSMVKFKLGAPSNETREVTITLRELL
jgi:clan AA aspartic protease (TIGR02281 family)